jgi:hypothetical protein
MGVHTVEMSSVSMIYIPSFIKIGSFILKLIVWDSQTDRQYGDLMSLFLFFKIIEEDKK